MEKKYTLGIDFGSLSGRAVLADVRNGAELASAVMDYPHAVMDRVLAKTGAPLPPDFALQDPADYLLVAGTVIPEALRQAGVSPSEVAGVCVDFTCCTVLPLDKNGTPLSMLPEFEREPHAYAKLWKHHAATPYADRMNEVARARGEKFLLSCGGAVSSEWLFPKIYETLDTAPAVYAAADSFMEAGDYLAFVLTGVRRRGYLYAAYKAQYDKKDGYPSEDYFAAVDRRLTHVVRDKLRDPVIMSGTPVGTVTPEAAERFGLAAGTPVAASMPDGHVAAAALDMKMRGDMFAVFGTSGCFYLLDDRYLDIPGICGSVPDGVIPGFYGYEAGLSCFGDHFAYAAKELTSPEYVAEAKAQGISMMKLLLRKAAAKKPGESGVLALNWFNGNRSVLVNYDLSGLFVGLTLSTRPEDLMRALIEATAFGTRNILNNFETHGGEIRRIIASGGIARKDPFTMQLFADVLKKEIRVAETAQAPALGSAINAAVAAGVYPDFPSAISAMSRVSDTVYRPDPENAPVYDRLFGEYMKLHDYFGRGGNDVMRELRRISAQARGLS